MGITPLYIGWGHEGSICISSEIKGLNGDCEHFEFFPPGHLYSGKEGGFKRWYNTLWYSEAIPTVSYDPIVLRKAFENAVIQRLMTDVPFGVLVSGGLGSSSVAAVTARHLGATKAAEQWGAQLHSFCVGLEGSPDLKAAKEVADYLGTVHHEFHFTVQISVDVIDDVIYHIETYDATTIRASTPMFLMARKIKSLGVKMVLSGEGSDEIFGGYLTRHLTRSFTRRHGARAAMGMHISAYEPHIPIFLNAARSPSKLINMMPRVIETTTPELTIGS